MAIYIKSYKNASRLIRKGLSYQLPVSNTSRKLTHIINGSVSEKMKSAIYIKSYKNASRP